MKIVKKGARGEYDLIDSLYRNPTFIQAGADICQVAAEEITRLHADLEEKYGDEEKPRYTTKRLRLEMERTRNAALEEAAAWHDKEADKYAEKRTWAHKLATHQISAAEIRALKTEPKP